MHIEKVTIENFKGFKGKFTIRLNPGLNIIVGDNEAGKSTILEAINLTLSGVFNGKYLRNELTQYLFNDSIVKTYLGNLQQGKSAAPPHILLEVYIRGEDPPLLEGDGNSERIIASGVSLKIELDEEYRPEYEALIKKKGNEIKSIPIEYYRMTWKGFHRTHITARSIPLKVAFIDSSTSRHQNGSDIYIGRIIKELLTPEEMVDISQSHRLMKEHFMTDPAIAMINQKIAAAGKITDKKVKISVELSARDAWEGGLTTYLDDIPFHFVGKGEQSVVKTNLALAHNKAKEANVILIEEPENHLSHTRLNQLIRTIKGKHDSKQILVTTHSSFVANKLGLSDLILLNEKRALRLNELSPDTQNFFEKIAGYDTLRLMLCDKAILVEGDSDELVVQKAYRLGHDDRLPIEDGIEIISVGTSFLRFLEVADKLKKKVCVVTDNDGNVEAVRKKYAAYLESNAQDNIAIYFDQTIDTGTLQIGSKDFNYNTLEPKLLKANSVEVLNAVFASQYTDEDGMHRYMHGNKTDCALKIFDTAETIIFPLYIMDALAWLES
jgi:putative ATP-dependent endonuclease of OLD family